MTIDATPRTYAAYVHTSGTECRDRNCQLAYNHDRVEFAYGDGPLPAN